MQKINASRVKAATRRRATTTILVAGDDGEPQEIELEIYYRGLSLDDTDQFKDVEGIEGEAERNEEIKRQLAFMVEEIPQFVDDDERPAVTDFAFFHELDVTYLNAISAAIRKQRSVPTRPSAS
jgi:hypothetical protein